MDQTCIVLLLLIALAGLCPVRGVAVSTAAELDAALQNQQIDTILLLNDIQILPVTTSNASRAPPRHLSAVAPPGTTINRSLHIGADPRASHLFLDCALVQDEPGYLLSSSVVLTLTHISLRNCSGIEELPYFAKGENVTVVLEDVIQDKGSYCAPPDSASDSYRQQPRPAGVPGAGPATEQQLSIPAAAGTNWCEAEPGIISPRGNPPVEYLCPFQPLLLQDVVLHMNNRPGQYGSWNLVYRNVLQVCPRAGV
jgi:hypothetical protein